MAWHDDDALGGMTKHIMRATMPREFPSFAQQTRNNSRPVGFEPAHRARFAPIWAQKHALSTCLQSLGLAIAKSFLTLRQARMAEHRNV
jgi:hypothetical protein